MDILMNGTRAASHRQHPFNEFNIAAALMLFDSREPILIGFRIVTDDGLS